MNLRTLLPVGIIGMLLVHTPTISQKKVATYFNVKGYTEQTARSYLTSTSIDPIEGIWQSND
jgi:hypothetical protein